MPPRRARCTGPARPPAVDRTRARPGRRELPRCRTWRRRQRLAARFPREARRRRPHRLRPRCVGRRHRPRRPRIVLVLVLGGGAACRGRCWRRFRRSTAIQEAAPHVTGELCASASAALFFALQMRPAESGSSYCRAAKRVLQACPECAHALRASRANFASLLHQLFGLPRHHGGHTRGFPF